MTDGDDGRLDQPGEPAPRCMSCRADLPPGRTVCPACGVIQQTRPTPPASPTPTARPASGLPSPPPPPGRVAPPPPVYPPPYVPGLAAHPRRSSTWVGATLVVLLLVVVAVAGAVVLLAAESGDDPDDRGLEAAPSATSSQPSDQPSASPRPINRAYLDDYCQSPGTARSDVPPHVAGEPARTWVDVIGSDPGNIVEPDSSLPPRPTGGSTVLSPQPDGIYSNNPSALVRTRSVTCITLSSVTETGERCESYYYEDEFGSLDESGPELSFDLAQARWQVTVYELHSGGVLHRGEILPPTVGCPDDVRIEDDATTLQHSLTDRMILDWTTSHFVGGAPS